MTLTRRPLGRPTRLSEAGKHRTVGRQQVYHGSVRGGRRREVVYPGVYREGGVLWAEVSTPKAPRGASFSLSYSLYHREEAPRGAWAGGFSGSLPVLDSLDSFIQCLTIKTVLTVLINIDSSDRKGGLCPTLVILLLLAQGALVDPLL